jgi:hypothetical protein
MSGHFTLSFRCAALSFQMSYVTHDDHNFHYCKINFIENFTHPAKILISQITNPKISICNSIQTTVIRLMYERIVL